MSSHAAEAWHELQETYGRLAPLIDRELKSTGGISLSWYGVLSQLSDEAALLRMSDLAARVALSRTRVSRLVDDLVAAGLLVREPNPTDGRSFLAKLTPAGRARLSQAKPHYDAAVEMLTGNLPAHEFGIVTELLRKLRNR